MYNYYQQVGGSEAWKPVPASAIDALNSPMFVTVLAVDKIVTDDMTKAERDKLKYAGPLYFDWDGTSIDDVTPNVIKLVEKLEKMGVNPDQLQLYATGKKGYHCLVPQKLFTEKGAKAGVESLPLIYWEVAFKLAVDSLDFRVYSGRKGRMWRQANVERENGKYKVAITYAELKEMTAQKYEEVCSTPRPDIKPAAATLCVDFAVLYGECGQKVKGMLARRSKQKTTKLTPDMRFPSLDAMMQNKGIKEGTGFHSLAMQLGIYANERGWTAQELVDNCKILIDEHESDGYRYDTPSKRAQELMRMHEYTYGNPCYTFAVGPLKALLTHAAPDLDGLPASQEEIETLIETPTDDEGVSLGDTPHEYNDLAGVVLNKYGVYAAVEFGGTKRISAVSFDNVRTLRSTDSGTISMVEADILVNGKLITRAPIELDTFHSATNFNKFAARFGHAFQGNDANVRGLYLRIMEKSKTSGNDNYACSREGLDVINIPNHEDERLRKPFLIWADGKGVVLEPRVAETGVSISFQGYPDPRGQFKSDLADAPKLVEWLEQDDNKEVLAQTLENLFNCHVKNVTATTIGWYVACFYRMLFHKAYMKFPLLHVNGAAGSGKSLRKGTLVLMASGEQRKIEDVKAGEQLLGPDGGIRNVLALGRGREVMYKVQPVKGEVYYVNESHILSLRRSYSGSCVLSDGTKVLASQELLNVNVKTWSESSAATQKMFKGWRASAVEFHNETRELPMDPYCLGFWLGDGRANQPAVYKPYCLGVQRWIDSAEAGGNQVQEFKYGDACSGWNVRAGEGSVNKVTAALRALNLIDNKHIPEQYLRGPITVRKQVLAGLLDSDGHLGAAGGYDWVSKHKGLSDQFVFLCRSLGLAAYAREIIGRIKSTGFEGVYYRVSVSGELSSIPCLDKKSPERKQIKSVLNTGLSFERLGVEDYYGVVLDGDHLFLLGDFTVTHNTEYNRSLLSFFYYNQEPKTLTPTSTTFAITFSASGSSSIPLVVDEYKPHEMPPAMHDRLKGMFRDAYNCRDVQRGGGTRESDDYRSLSSTMLSSPMAFIAETMEDESALMERVVLVTMSRPTPMQASKNLSKFIKFSRNRHLLAILGKYIAASIVNTYSVDKLIEEFDPIVEASRTKYLLQEGDLEKLTPLELQEKFSAKERTVFNFTVAKFGLKKFKDLLHEIYGTRFDQMLDDISATTYDRMADSNSSTQAEWLKVVNSMVDMSAADETTPYKLRVRTDYAHIVYGGVDCVEISLRACYAKYRMYCRAVATKPLFNGETAFLHGIRDASAVACVGYTMGTLKVPGGSVVFDSGQLNQLGVRAFKT